MREREREAGGKQFVTVRILFCLVLFSIYLDPLQINGIHHGALKKLDGGGVPLQQAFQLQIGFFPVSHGQRRQKKHGSVLSFTDF